jgi:hypothetical protein
MSAAAPALPLAISSSVEELAVAFPLELQRVFDRLEAIGKEQSANARKKPSDQTLDWAREVLLGVVPSTYLIGAEINPFESEIHVTWEDDYTGKSVIVFFPDPRQLKIYHEWIQNGAVVKHELVNTQSVSDVSDRLRWFFQ